MGRTLTHYLSLQEVEERGILVKKMFSTSYDVTCP